MKIITLCLCVAVVVTCANSDNTTTPYYNICDENVTESFWCFGSMKMWRYDQQAGQCVQFYYRHCGVKGNKFDTEQQCLDTCGEHTTQMTTTIDFID